jgi:hypothetical protein
MEQIFEKKLMEAAQAVEEQVIRFFNNPFDCHFQLG